MRMDRVRQASAIGQGPIKSFESGNGQQAL
jgi:hypothetical protein